MSDGHRHQLGLLKLVDAVSQKAGGKEDEEDTGDVEEEAQVKAIAAAVNAIGEGGGDDNAQGGADGGLPGGDGASGGEEKDGRLQALAEDGREGDKG